MKPADLIDYIQKYVETYPDMANCDVTITESHKRRVKGSFYQHYKMTSWGFNSLTGKGFNIGIEKLGQLSYIPSHKTEYSIRYLMARRKDTNKTEEV